VRSPWFVAALVTAAVLHIVLAGDAHAAADQAQVNVGDTDHRRPRLRVWGSCFHAVTPQNTRLDRLLLPPPPLPICAAAADLSDASLRITCAGKKLAFIR
jgi:hypothetical protein